jgi:ketosteroid isomerase-like protein
MSQENVEVVKTAFAAWNRRDMDFFRDLLHPEVLARPPENWPDASPDLGREAVMRTFEQLRDTWDEDSVELVDDFIDVGDRVAVRMVWHGVGHGPESRMEWTYVGTVRGGLILNIEYFWDHDQALRAMGLE